MDINKYICWCSCLIVVFVGIMTIISIYQIKQQVTSSPVERMYYKQLVVTLDSILDARFDAGYCEEAIDSNDVSATHTRFSGVLSPME